MPTGASIIKQGSNYVLGVMSYALNMMDHDGLCIQNDELCINNDENQGRLTIPAGASPLGVETERFE